MNKLKEISSYFENLSLFVLGLFFLLLPLLFLSITTDSFILPKEIALAGAIGLFFVFFIVKTVVEGKLTFRGSPFDLPILLFLIACLASAVFSQNRFDALIGFVPLLFIVFLYFGIVNAIKGKKQLTFILSSLVLGASLASILSVASFFKIYLLPFEYTHVAQFTTFGSLLDQAIYFALVLPIAGQFLFQKLVSSRKEKLAALSPFEAVQETHLPKQKFGMFAFFTVNFFVVLAGLAISVYLLFTTQKPIILPLEVGLQTALAAISQDTGNVLKSLLVGSGIGTFLSDFTRFKEASYNANADLWAFTFFRSSTYILELVATTGVLGIAAFLLLIFRVFKERTFFLPLLLAIVAAFILPFSFTTIALFFILLAIFAVTRIFSSSHEKVSEIEFYFVAFKKRFLGEHHESENSQNRHGRFLSIVFSLVILVVIGVPLYFVTMFFASDLAFQQALVAASKNDGTKTYDLEVLAINRFPYRDVYYRAFSQTNLALASLLVQQAQGAKPDEKVQENILTLIQQSINAGRSATTVAPLTSFNWNNLSSIYRSLIGFGQNADQFTILTAQQAIALDANNPQQYIELGGIYYQLGNYDEAIRQFQYAATLKQNYANAYYNLGHAFEMKNNLEQALQAYQIVKRLVEGDTANTQKIDAEITAIQAKIGQQAAANPTTDVTGQGEQQPINVNQPTTQLPERKPPVEIDGPPSITPLPTKAVTPSPSPAN